MKKYKITTITTTAIFTIAFIFFCIASFQSSLSILPIDLREGMWDVKVSFDSGSGELYQRSINVYGILSVVILLVSLLLFGIHIGLNWNTKPKTMDKFLYVLLALIVILFLIGITAIPNTAVDDPNSNMSWLFKVPADPESAKAVLTTPAICCVSIFSIAYVGAISWFAISLFRGESK